MRITLGVHDESISVLLLNNLDGVSVEAFKADWTRANKRYCADGALHLLKQLNIDLDPDYLIGDMDSISEQELNDFKARSKGKVIRIADQDQTDFEKCVSVYNEKHTKDEWLVVYGALGGARLDHQMAAFHAIMRSPLCIKLQQQSSFAFMIPPDQDIELLVDDLLVGNQCGLFPIAGPTTVTTRGLKWDLDNATLQYGRMISVSNVIMQSPVMVKCNANPLLMTVQLAK